MKTLSEVVIKGLKDHPFFTDLKEWIFSKMEELDSVDGLEGLTDEQAGQEAKARIKAATMLKEILSPFMEYREKRERTPEEIQAAKDKTGL